MAEPGFHNPIPSRMVIDLNPQMEIMATSALEGDFNATSVLPGVYMPLMAPSTCGIMIQSNGQDLFTRNIDADSASIIDDAHFELPLYSTTETSWYSSSSEDMDVFYQLEHCNISQGHSHPQSFNVANNIVSVPESSMLYRQSAFGPYIRSAHCHYVKNGRQNLMKRCFKFLRKVNEKRTEAQRFQIANIEEQHEFHASLQNKAAFHHMLAERNRRTKLKQHFSLLHSLLPHNSKRDKYSILSNTWRYMSELKRRVEELEHRNRALEESLRVKFSKKEGCTSFDERHEEHEATLVYKCDEFTLKQSKNMPNQADMRINVQIDPLSSRTNLIILLLERLRELQLEVASVQSNVQPLNLEAHFILIQPKGNQWESSNWENVVKVVRSIFAVNDCCE